MLVRYDGYYEKDIPYLMSMEELVDVLDSGNASESMILAYIRNVGADKLLIKTKTYMPEGMLQLPFYGIMLCDHDRRDFSLCRIVEGEDPAYNPLSENHNSIHKDHWYAPYKIQYTSIEFDGVVEKMYFSDFCSLVNKGLVEFIEYSEIGE